jgi:hypothetical protein
MVRFASFPTAAALLVASMLPGARVSAQELPPPTLRQMAEAAAISEAPSRPPAIAARAPERRPGALVPLYVSFSALQVLDTHSTSRALQRGAVEANPAMKGIASNEIAMLAVKAAGTSGLIFASEKMWKENKAAAVVFMVAANSAMVWVVQRNYGAVR